MKLIPSVSESFIDIGDILQCPVTLLSVKGLGRFLPGIINIVDIFAITMMLCQILAEYLLKYFIFNSVLKCFKD